MTSLVIEQLTDPQTARDAQALNYSYQHAAQELAGRTVWSVRAARTGSAFAAGLEGWLRGASDDGVSARRMRLRVSSPLGRLVERLDAMLGGAGADLEPLGPEAREIYLEGVQAGDELIGNWLGSGDVVVVHDPVAIALAEAIRSRGAHVAWSARVEPADSSAARAWRFLHRERPCLDAYITPWRPRGVAAFVAARDSLCVKELSVRERGSGGALERVGWASLLADVVKDDRGETVGGTLHARPTVGAR